MFQRREVQYSEGEEFMRKKGISFFFETSAFNGQNIELVIQQRISTVNLLWIGLPRGR